MQDKLLIITNLKKTILYIEKTVINYPNKYKVLKDKIISSLYDILELTYYTNCLEDKKNIQYLIISKIKMLDFYFMISLNNKLINQKKYVSYTNYLLDITKLIYGWINETNK